MYGVICRTRAALFNDNLVKVAAIFDEINPAGVARCTRTASAEVIIIRAPCVAYVDLPLGERGGVDRVGRCRQGDIINGGTRNANFLTGALIDNTYRAFRDGRGDPCADAREVDGRVTIGVRKAIFAVIFFPYISVIATATTEAIVTGAAPEFVVATTGADAIIACSTLDRVIAQRGGDAIVSLAALNRPPGARASACNKVTRRIRGLTIGICAGLTLLEIADLDGVSVCAALQRTASITGPDRVLACTAVDIKSHVMQTG